MLEILDTGCGIQRTSYLLSSGICQRVLWWKSNNAEKEGTRSLWWKNGDGCSNWLRNFWKFQAD